MDLLRNEVEKHEETRKEIIAAMDAERRDKSNMAKHMRLQEAEMLKAERKALYDQRHEMQLQVILVYWKNSSSCYWNFLSE